MVVMTGIFTVTAAVVVERLKDVEGVGCKMMGVLRGLRNGLDGLGLRHLFCLEGNIGENEMIVRRTSTPMAPS